MSPVSRISTPEEPVSSLTTIFVSLSFPCLIISNSTSYSAGQDATEAFFGLHRHEVLERPQYKRLQIAVIDNEEPQLIGRVKGEINKVPYAEPSWLVEGFHSPYYKEVRLPSFSVFSASRLLILCPSTEP